MTDMEVTDRCARAGLSLRGLERRGALLLLQPDGTDSLPTPDALSALADELKGATGARWVALDLEGVE